MIDKIKLDKFIEYANNHEITWVYDSINMDYYYCYPTKNCELCVHAEHANCDFINFNNKEFDELSKLYPEYFI